MWNKKGQRTVAAVIAVVLVLAMLVPILAEMLV